MEQEILRLLGELQSTAEGPRRNAETQITALYANDALPVALMNIASAQQLDMTARQAALLILKRYVQHCWSPSFEEFKGQLVRDDVKAQMRVALLGLVTDEQRKIRAAASYVVSKIASQDFPEEWPTLVQDLLKLISEGSESQVHGALRVLSDLINDGFSDEQFFSTAKALISVVYGVATHQSRNYSIRALAVHVFFACIEMLEMVKEDHPNAVNDFAKEILDLWVPFFVGTLSGSFPETDDITFDGVVTLRIQIIRTIMQIRKVFGSLLAPFLGQIFAVTWQELNTVKDRYVRDFVINETEGKLVDLDSLPYSLDLLVLEQLDFIQTCLKNKAVRDELARVSAGGGAGSPLVQMVNATVALSQVASEDEGMWEVDLNVFLCEETSISANYTPRSASGDLILKLGESFQHQTEAALWEYTQQIFKSGESTRQIKEAALFIWDELLSEFAEINRKINPSIASNLLEYVVSAIGSNLEEEQFLRARGYYLAGTLTKAAPETVGPRVTELIDQTIRASTTDPSDIVKISCIKVLQKYCEIVDLEIIRPYQASIIGSVRSFLAHKPHDEAEDSQDVLAELMEALRGAVGLNYSIAIDPNVRVVELIFAIAHNGPTSMHLQSLVQDLFQDIAEELYENFVPLCEMMLPFISAALDVGMDGKNHPLMDLAADVLAVLARNGSEPLPNGFVATVVPRLQRILIQCEESDVLQSGCEALGSIVKHDLNQLIQWHDADGKSGLEVTLVIIDRLLRPDIPDNSALEVGGLAAEVVEKASEHLGPFLASLLRAVAERLATAQSPPFIQSLILVFARLVLKQAKDVVDFLAGLTIGDVNGLQIVLGAWLENSSSFSGYEEIRQNVIALSLLYRLQDPRLSQIMVKGDLIVPESNRIMTRSKAKQNPDRFTMIPVPLKIVKLLVLELGSTMGDATKSYYNSSQLAAESDSEDEGEGWEDMPASLNIPGISTEELMALGGGSGRVSRQANDETYAYLTSFFRELSTTNLGDFQTIYAALKQEEQLPLNQLLGSQS
ncbi:uncharacterized protein H6S33_004733 [Morchella sextelata]|uniref:uncharacterized protein n=1 Tax=Morchella sextelata TaxID=1174677 RepID=UPI001D045F51|nr:uncharacterized protein H6S33_004733 [Morchella sextelata]KAH0605511.1 hypothetical protein H6S33_004733 [Morchella sextelata]